MTGKRIVIDAGVWNHWHNVTDEDTSSFEVIENYIQSKNDEILCLDEDGIIMKQCGRNTSGDFYRIYMMCYDRIDMVSSEMPGDIIDELKTKLGFHEDSDICYVGVAMNSDKIIITLDGDFGIYPDEYYRSLKDANAKHAVANYMKNELKLRVFTSEMYLDEESV